ncbi:MAG: phosphate/phosphite/phosphonate ABC transporter substrate-binding protein [Caldimicrobium sp.]
MSVLKKLVRYLLLLFCLFPLNLRADDSLIFLISPMTSPVSTLSKFYPFAKYLENRLGKKVIIKQRKTYEEINKLLGENKAHFAYICTGGYLTGRKKYNLELLAIPVINNKKSYQAYVIVHKESPYEKVEDLKNKTFLFTDPLSLTGNLYIKAYLKERGYAPEKFFKKTYFTGSHEKSIEAVSKKLADGASIDSLVYEEMLSKKDPIIKNLKIIHTSQEFGIPPFVVSPSLNPIEKQRILKVLLKMHEDPEGQKILKHLGIDRFEPPDHTLYAKTLKILKLSTP